MMTTSRDTARPLSFLEGARGVFALTFDGMLWSRRSALMAAFLASPVVVSLAYRMSGMMRYSVTDVYALAVVLCCVRNLVPLVALFYASALVADEVEGKTLTYLLTRPIARGAILGGKLAAYLATTLTLSLPGVVLTFFILASTEGLAGLTARAPALFQDTGVVALAFVVYGALFTLLGVLLRRPMIPGLLFLFSWEFLTYSPGYVPRVTITAYLRSLVSHQPPSLFGVVDLFQPSTIPVGESLLTLVVLSVALLFAAAAVFKSREYVMEQ